MLRIVLLRLRILLVVLLTLTTKPLRRPAVSTADLISQRLIYPVAEAAQLLGCHSTTLYDFVRQGRLTLTRSGGRTFVTADELSRFLREETETVQVKPRRTA